MGTCFGVGNVFWQIENGENATGTHFQKRIFWAFKGLVWSQGSVYQMGEIPRIPKIPLTHFWPNAGKTCFDKLVLICNYVCLLSKGGTFQPPCVLCILLGSSKVRTTWDWGQNKKRYCQFHFKNSKCLSAIKWPFMDAWCREEALKNCFLSNTVWNFAPFQVYIDFFLSPLSPRILPHVVHSLLHFSSIQVLDAMFTSHILV